MPLVELQLVFLAMQVVVVLVQQVSKKYRATPPILTLTYSHLLTRFLVGFARQLVHSFTVFHNTRVITFLTGGKHTLLRYFQEGQVSKQLHSGLT